MPITYESAAPVAAAANIYEQEAHINAQRQQAMAAAASSGYGHQAQVPYDTGIQDAINHRDNAQFAVQRDNADRQAAFGLQNQKFQLEAQLSTMQLTQQENMRLARMKNAIGDVQNDPTLSAQEKSEITLQLKTGIDPLARRDAAAKVKSQEQLNEAKAKELDFQAGHQKRTLDIMGMTMKDRQGWVPDLTELSKISEDIEKNHDFGNMLPQERDAAISKLAEAEALRQGLGHHTLLQPDGKVAYLKGDGSMGASQSGKSITKPGQDHPTGLSPMDYLKAREQAENQAHKEQQMQTEGDFPGDKKHVHPQSVEWKQERVRQIMGGLGLPADMVEYNKQKTATAQSGYDPSKAAWNKNKQVAAAASSQPTPTQPATEQKPFDFQDHRSQTPEQKQLVTQMKTQETQISDSKSPPEFRQAAMAAHGEAKMMVMKYGSYANMPDKEKAKYVELAKTIAAAIKNEKPPVSQEQLNNPGSFGTPAAAATPQPAEKPGFFGNVAKGAGEMADTLGNLNFSKTGEEFRQIGDNIDNGPIGRMYRGMNRNKLRAGER